MKQKEEKYCGECCWFYAEDTYGFGACPFQFAEVRACDRPCNSEENFVSKDEMNHNIEVLERYKKFWEDQTWKEKKPKTEEIVKATFFALRYMKVFSNL